MKAIRIKEAHIKILNSNTSINTKHSQSIDLDSGRLRGVKQVDNNPTDDSDDDNVKMSDEIVDNVHRSINMNNSKPISGTQQISAKTIDIQKLSSDEETPSPVHQDNNLYPSGNVCPSDRRSSSLMRKSRVIFLLFIQLLLEELSE